MPGTIVFDEDEVSRVLNFSLGNAMEVMQSDTDLYWELKERRQYVHEVEPKLERVLKGKEKFFASLTGWVGLTRAFEITLRLAEPKSEERSHLDALLKGKTIPQTLRVNQALQAAILEEAEKAQISHAKAIAGAYRKFLK